METSHISDSTLQFPGSDRADLLELSEPINRKPKSRGSRVDESHFALRTVVDAHFAVWLWVHLLRWGGGGDLRMHRYDSALQSCQPTSAAPCPDPSAQIFFQLKEAQRALAWLLAAAVLRR